MTTGFIVAATMNRFRWVLFFLFCQMVFSQLQAQEKTINARIIIDFDEGSAENIYVTNLRTRLSTITDATGNFKIKATAGDSLLIRSYQYETRRFYLQPSLMNKELITIHLNLETVVLDEAILSNRLTGYLDKDAKYNSQTNNIDQLYKEMGINKDASKLRDTANFKFGRDLSLFHLNVEKVLESMTGDLRRRRNLYAFEGREAVIVAIEGYFGEDYFVQDLSLPKEKIRDFIFYAYGSSSIPTYYQKNDYLSIMIEMGKLAPSYLERLKNWYVPNEDTVE